MFTKAHDLVQMPSHAPSSVKCARHPMCLQLPSCRLTQKCWKCPRSSSSAWSAAVFAATPSWDASASGTTGMMPISESNLGLTVCACRLPPDSAPSSTIFVFVFVSSLTFHPPLLDSADSILSIEWGYCNRFVHSQCILLCW